MIRRPPRCQRTDTRFPYTTLFRSQTDIASADQSSQGSEIVVTGIRSSLERAAEIKQNAVQVVDSIVAEDIGKLPDPTTAAALQRVPGVQVSNDRNKIGRASCGKECVSKCRSRWSPSH